MEDAAVQYGAHTAGKLDTNPEGSEIKATTVTY